MCSTTKVETAYRQGMSSIHYQYMFNQWTVYNTSCHNKLPSCMHLYLCGHGWNGQKPISNFASSQEELEKKTHPGHTDLFDFEHLFLSDVSIPKKGTCRCKLSTPLYIDHFVRPLGGQIIEKALIKFSNGLYHICNLQVILSFVHPVIALRKIGVCTIVNINALVEYNTVILFLIFISSEHWRYEGKKANIKCFHLTV